MFVTLRGRALARRRRPAFLKCSSSAWLVCFGALLGQTCGALPPIPFVGPDPANPDAPAPPSSYQSVISTYSSLRPAEPGGWLEQNQRAATPSGTVAHEVNVAQAGESIQCERSWGNGRARTDMPGMRMMNTKDTTRCRTNHGIDIEDTHST